MIPRLGRAPLLLLVIAIFGYSSLLLYFSVTGVREPHSTPPNNPIREEVATWPLLRDVFFLHSYGDGKADYLLPKYRAIEVEIDYLGSLLPSEEVRGRLEKDIERLVEKDVRIRLSDRLPERIEGEDGYSQTELAALEEEFREVRTGEGAGALYILVVSTSEERPTNVGATIGENSLAIFQERISNLPTYRSDATRLEVSTVLHEFGHLLGLGHSEGGVMAEQVEVRSGRIAPSNYWFSESDLAKIRALRAQYSS